MKRPVNHIRLIPTRVRAPSRRTPTASRTTEIHVFRVALLSLVLLSGCRPAPTELFGGGDQEVRARVIHRWSLSLHAMETHLRHGRAGLPSNLEHPAVAEEKRRQWSWSRVALRLFAAGATVDAVLAHRATPGSAAASQALSAELAAWSQVEYLHRLRAEIEAALPGLDALSPEGVRDRIRVVAERFADGAGEASDLVELSALAARRAIDVEPAINTLLGEEAERLAQQYLAIRDSEPSAAEARSIGAAGRELCLAAAVPLVSACPRCRDSLEAFLDGIDADFEACLRGERTARSWRPFGPVGKCLDELLTVQVRCLNDPEPQYRAPSLQVQAGFEAKLSWWISWRGTIRILDDMETVAVEVTHPLPGGRPWELQEWAGHAVLPNADGFLVKLLEGRRLSERSEPSRAPFEHHVETSWKAIGGQISLELSRAPGPARRHVYHPAAAKLALTDVVFVDEEERARSILVPHLSLEYQTDLGRGARRGPVPSAE